MPFKRPWGHYEILKSEHNFQVKVITVLPGQCLSLQYHNYRSEHWIIVRGTASVIKGESQQELSVNDHIHIDKLEKHRICNRESTTLTLVEVQFGDYLGEDDIVRLTDMYDRT